MVCGQKARFPNEFSMFNVIIILEILYSEVIILR
jgi:hypothetical protein